MKLSAKTEYALLALIQLAEDHAQGQPASMRALAERQPIPDGFLVQILQELRRAGLVTSTRGACGGYRLARPAAEISLCDVLCVMDGDDPLRSNLANPTPLAEVLVDELEEARRRWQEQLREVTLEDLASRAAELGSPMWYI
ncbi:HTH-type transcriptional regulator CymR [Posidoniimonas polymericola]|uniref:HTH-type transcriptional regulator CymR n=1 Tax=Posidoniimonas polymericola TaxID=2528002 RepID=A0A5C5ZCU5_9BACT|nr:Rrf2 family transcriptional regulator [Posidoniimonas polymericola]TWT85229.1 HTH-type transcriptional regulator CymR [Posidoniimonas polymericola]